MDGGLLSRVRWLRRRGCDGGSRGRPLYIGLGCAKGLTLGGLAVWWVVDAVRIYNDGFPDGNGAALFDDW